MVLKGQEPCLPQGIGPALRVEAWGNGFSRPYAQWERFACGTLSWCAGTAWARDTGS